MFVNQRSIFAIKSGNVSDIVRLDLLGISPPFGKDFIYGAWRNNLLTLLNNLLFFFCFVESKYQREFSIVTVRATASLRDKLSHCIRYLVINDELQCN